MGEGTTPCTRSQPGTRTLVGFDTLATGSLFPTTSIHGPLSNIIARVKGVVKNAHQCTLGTGRGTVQWPSNSKTTYYNLELKAAMATTVTGAFSAGAICRKPSPEYEY